MRILVTGGAGFIGSHLCERLMLDGNQITVLDSASTGRFSNLSSIVDSPQFKIVEGSILETNVLNPLIKDADYVFHLAAAVGSAPTHHQRPVRPSTAVVISPLHWVARQCGHAMLARSAYLHGRAETSSTGQIRWRKTP